MCFSKTDSHIFALLHTHLKHCLEAQASRLLQVVLSWGPLVIGCWAEFSALSTGR
jgi:hypothetical protein